MLDLNLIRNDTQKVVDALQKKGHTVDFTELLQWDQERKAKKQSVESLKAPHRAAGTEFH